MNNQNLTNVNCNNKIEVEPLRLQPRKQNSSVLICGYVLLGVLLLLSCVLLWCIEERSLILTLELCLYAVVGVAIYFLYRLVDSRNRYEQEELKAISSLERKIAEEVVMRNIKIKEKYLEADIDIYKANVKSEVDQDSVKK